MHPQSNIENISQQNRVLALYDKIESELDVQDTDKTISNETLKDELNILEKTISDNNNDVMWYQRPEFPKAQTFLLTCIVLESLLVLAYFKYFELPETSEQDLLNLYTKYQNLQKKIPDILKPSKVIPNSPLCTQVAQLSILDREYFNFFAASSNPKFFLNHPFSLLEVYFYSFESLLKEAFTKFDLKCYFNDIKDKLTQKKGLIFHVYLTPLTFTPIGFFGVAQALMTEIMGSFSILFNEKSLVSRIYLATLTDNVALLKLFFKEYEAQYPDKAKDFITSNALMGLAASNGCAESVKLFVEMGANIEQIFILEIPFIEYKNYQREVKVSGICLTENNFHSKNLLNDHANSILQMTSLALLLCAVPAMKKDEAYKKLDILLKVGATYNKKLLKKKPQAAKNRQDVSNDNNSPLAARSNFHDANIVNELFTEDVSQKELSTIDKMFRKFHIRDNKPLSSSPAKTQKPSKKKPQAAKNRQDVSNDNNFPPATNEDAPQKEPSTLDKTLHGFHATDNKSLNLSAAQAREIIKAKISEYEKKGEFAKASQLCELWLQGRWADAMKVIYENQTLTDNGQGRNFSYSF